MEVVMDHSHFQSLTVILFCSIHLIEGKYLGPVNQTVIATTCTNVTLKCRIINQPGHSGVKWSYKNPNEVKPSDITLGSKQPNGEIDLRTQNPRYSFVESVDEEVFDFHINCVELYDAGNYTCTSGTQFQKTAQLVVKYYGPPTLLKAPEDITVKGGSTVRLECHAIGTDDVVWIFYNDTAKITLARRQRDRLGEILYNTDRISFPMGAGWSEGLHDIELANVRQSDSGLYTCLVRGIPPHGEFVTQAPFQLEVTVCDVHTFAVKPCNKDVLVGGQATFHCRSPQGYLPGVFHVDWVKFSPRETSANSVRIEANSGTLQTEISNINYESWDYDNFDINIKNITKPDWGFYTCELKLEPLKCPYNDVPTRATATLFVDTKPDMSSSTPSNPNFAPPLSMTSRTQKYNIGDNAYLQCDISEQSYGSKVFWFDENFNLMFDGARRISTDMRIRVSRNENKQWHLFIKDIDYDDVGNYYCLVDAKPVMWQKVMLDAHGCPKTKLGNWVRNKSGGKCYSPPSFATSYGAAEVLCKQNAGGYLAMPKTEEEVSTVVNVTLESKLDSSDVWIGLDNLDRGSHFIWNDGSPLLDNQAKWTSNTLAAQTCVVLDIGTKMFKLEKCSKSMPFICEVAEDSWRLSLQNQRQRCPDNWVYFQCGGFCYWAAAEPMTRSSARLKCGELGGSLLDFFDIFGYLNQGKLIRITRPAQGIGFSEIWMAHKRPSNTSNTLKTSKPRLYFNDSWGEKIVHDQALSDQFVKSFKPKNDQDCLVLGYARAGLIGRSYGIYPRRCDLKRMCFCKRHQYISPTHTYACGKGLPLNQYYLPLSNRALPRKQKRSSFENATNGDHHPIKMTTRWNTKKPKYIQRRQANNALNLGKLLRGKPIGIESFPWFAQLYIQRQYAYRFICGAAIVGDRFVMTAAHCLYSNMKKDEVGNLRVVIGTKYKNPYSGMMYSVKSTHTDNYDIKNKGNKDIALLELASDIHFDCPDVGHICMDDTDHIDLRQSECYYACMGEGSDGILTYCRLDNFKQSETEKVYRTEWWYCEVGGGDSGSPLMCRKKTRGAPWHLFGVAIRSSMLADGSIEFTKLSPYYHFFKHIMASLSPQKSAGVSLSPYTTSVLLISLLIAALGGN